MLGCLLLACEGGPLRVGERNVPLVAAAGEPTSPLGQPHCAEEAAWRVPDAECWPTRHVGRWHGFVTGDAHYWSFDPTPREYPSDDVSLEVDATGSASIRFSGADAGAGEPCAGAEPCAESPGLVLGFAYALSGLRMTGGANEDRHLDPRMDFSLRIAEPWDGYCTDLALDAGPCACSAAGCGASPRALVGDLELSQDGLALRGSLRSSGSGAELTAGWEFVRE
jgi:hypothetical protein